LAAAAAAAADERFNCEAGSGGGGGRQTGPTLACKTIQGEASQRFPAIAAPALGN